MSKSTLPSPLSTSLGPDPSGARPRPSLELPRHALNTDTIFAWLARTGALCIILMLAALLVVLATSAWPSIRAYGPEFLVTSEWRPNQLEIPEKDATGRAVIQDGQVRMQTIPPRFGALPVIYGTAVSSLLAILFAVPLSFGTALFLVRLCPKKLTGPVSFLIELLAAIPSIAYGMWGLFVLGPFLQGGGTVWSWLGWLMVHVPGATWSIQHIFPWVFEIHESAEATTIRFRGLEPIFRSVFGHIPGLGWLFTETITQPGGGGVIHRELPLTGHDMFCGGLVLAIMILPIITAISRDVLRNVPRAQIEGTQALGATWWQSSWEMLRYSRSALFGAVILGLARASGETMAITMVIGNNNQIHPSLFAPAQTMSSLLANEFAEASSAIHRSALCEVALILLLMSLIFNIVARWLVVGKGSRTAAAF